MSCLIYFVYDVFLILLVSGYCDFERKTILVLVRLVLQSLPYKLNLKTYLVYFLQLLATNKQSRGFFLQKMCF